MKKMIVIIIFFLFGIIEAKAYSLSARGIELMSYSYQVEEETKHFFVFINNRTEQLIFTRKPFQEPSPNLDYQDQSEKMFELEENIQNQINFYMKETQKAEDFKTQMFYYMNTQILIWKSFNPNISIEIPEDEERESYKRELEEKYEQIPSWIQDTEFTSTLQLPKEKEYKLSSDTCEITELESLIEIKNCQENAEVFIEESWNTLTMPSHELSQLIEGYGPRKWKIKLHQKKEEPIFLKENLTFEINSDITIQSLIHEENKVEIINANEKIDTSSLGEKEVFIQYKVGDTRKEQKEKIQIIDSLPPTIEYQKEIITTVGTKIDLLKDVIAWDNSKEQIEVTIKGEYDFESVGIYNLKYIAKDKSNNIKEESFTLKVQQKINSDITSSKPKEETEEIPSMEEKEITKEVPDTWIMEQVPNTKENMIELLGVIFFFLLFVKKGK